ncbi:MAG TPA: FAD-dependent monooxygenase [Kofleriaceae bacterium]
MHVIVVGGGIGGLTLGLLLHARGIGCEIYEAAPAMRELGVGINVLPHAIAELAELGLLARLDEVAVRTRELIYTNRFGQEVWRELRGLDVGYEVPQLSIHRGRLHGVLYRAVIERLGRDAVHTGHRLTGFAQDGRVACAWFDGGRSAAGDAVIGCDGIHSAVRRQLYAGARIDDVIGRAEREAIVNGYARLAGFAPDQVNHVDRPARESRRV